MPHNLYRTDQARELDRIAIEEYGLGNGQLMARAGQRAFDLIRRLYPGARRLSVVCGRGNNGGDGYVTARLAALAGLSPTVYQVGDPAKLEGDAKNAHKAAWTANVPMRPFHGEPLGECDLLVDALLGTGLKGEVTGSYRQAIGAMNAAGVPVLALDIPSGLDGDTGRVLGEAVRATTTITFIAAKRGLLTGEGPDRTGRLFFADLDVPPEIYSRLSPACRRLGGEIQRTLLKPRRRTAHKGDFGHVLVVGGDHGMAGAALLAAQAAARVGAGLTTVATRARHEGLLTAARPELMWRGVEQESELELLLLRASVVALGPGLGRDRWGRMMLSRVLAAELPVVADADALNLLAENPHRRENWVITPHPGEAGRLLDHSAAEVQADRFDAVEQLHQRFGGVAVLKGPGTLVLGPSGETALCDGGNPGMASGGMGDLLTGIIAGLVAQGLPVEQAARLGVSLHASAGDAAAKAKGERGLLAGDLFDPLQRLCNPTA